MVSDPAWFPSAAMQTLGAMYAIFVAVYVLVLQKMVIQKEPTLHRLANFFFILLSVVVGLTIILNALILYGICVPNSVMDLSHYMEVGLLVFVISVTYLLLVTILFSVMITKHRKQ